MLCPAFTSVTDQLIFAFMQKIANNCHQQKKHFWNSWAFNAKSLLIASFLLSSLLKIECEIKNSTTSALSKRDCCLYWQDNKSFQFSCSSSLFSVHSEVTDSHANTSSRGDLPNKPKSFQSSVEALDTTRPNKFPSSSNYGQFFLPPLSVTSSPWRCTL